MYISLFSHSVSVRSQKLYSYSLTKKKASDKSEALYIIYKTA